MCGGLFPRLFGGINMAQVWNEPPIDDGGETRTGRLKEWLAWIRGLLYRLGSAAWANIGTNATDVAAGVHGSTHSPGGTDPLDASGFGFAPLHHASQHFTGASDPLTAQNINAANRVHTHVMADITSGSVPITMLPVGTGTGKVAAGTHAATHATGGADPITPESIGIDRSSFALKTDLSQYAKIQANGKLLPQYLFAPITSVTNSIDLDGSLSGRRVEVNSSDNITITIVENPSIPFIAEDEIEISREGTGTVTITSEPNVNIRGSIASAPFIITNQYGIVALKRKNSTEWRIAGEYEGIS